jgi:hypothetical protein
MTPSLELVLGAVVAAPELRMPGAAVEPRSIAERPIEEEPIAERPIEAERSFEGALLSALALTMRAAATMAAATAIQTINIAAEAPTLAAQSIVAALWQEVAPQFEAARPYEGVAPMLRTGVAPMLRSAAVAVADGSSGFLLLEGGNQRGRRATATAHVTHHSRLARRARA